VKDLQQKNSNDRISGSLQYTWMTLVAFPALKWKTLPCDYLQAVVGGESPADPICSGGKKNHLMRVETKNTPEQLDTPLFEVVCVPY